MAIESNYLRKLQAPLKSAYREKPSAAQLVLKAEGSLQPDGLACSVATGFGVANAGLHPATGGDGMAACSGDMLLQSLVACAGVTLTSVAAALDIELKGGTVHAEGDLDFRGTLGVARDAAVGFSNVRLHFDLETEATPQQLDKLVELTERYCVVYQTLRNSPNVDVSHGVSSS